MSKEKGFAEIAAEEVKGFAEVGVEEAKEWGSAIVDVVSSFFSFGSSSKVEEKEEYDCKCTKKK